MIPIHHATMALTPSPQLSVALLCILNWLILPTMAKCTSESHFNITTVPGYFMQDDKDTDPDTFDYVYLPSPRPSQKAPSLTGYLSAR